MKKWTIPLASVVVALLVSSSALASGGSGGGGGGGGGGGVIAPPSPSGPCASISSFQPTVGFFGNIRGTAAVWVNWKVQDCGSGGTYIVAVVETNTATGQVEWASVGRYAIGSRSSQSGIWDNDFAPLSTSYRVDMVVVSTATGQIVAQAGANVTTPGLKLGS